VIGLGSVKELAHPASSVRERSIPNQDDGITDVAAQVAQEVDHHLAVDVLVRVQRKVKSYPSTLGRNRQHGDDRDLVPMAVLDQDRRTTSRCPGSTDKRRGQEAALVEEDQRCLQARGVFFTRRQITLTQRWIPSSSRSRTRFSGRWGLHPMERRSLPI